MSEQREPQETGFFACGITKLRSPAIRCMDVLDSFPCLTCGAGLNGQNLSCRNLEQAARDGAVITKWNAQRSLPTDDSNVQGGA